MNIFVISLRDSEDRRQRVINTFNELNVPFTFFDAIDGRIGLPKDLETYPDHTHRKWFRSRPLSPGELGCYASHYRLWQKCAELNEPIIVIEDDFLPTEFFHQVIEKLPKFMLKGYEYLRLELQGGDFTPLESEGGYQTVFWHDNGRGTRAYAITPAGATKLLNHNGHWLCAVDNHIGESYRTKLVCAGLLPYAVVNPADMDTTIQIGKKTKVKLVFKLTREMYRFYKFARQLVWNKIGLLQFKRKQKL